MKFNSIRNVKLVNIRNFTSKAGRACTFLTLADPETYESADFMPLQGLDTSKLNVGGDYSAVLHYDGRYTNVELLPAVKG
jgi:hypothetical protein